MGIYGVRRQEALGTRLTTMHELPAGEGAKQSAVAEAPVERAAARPRRHDRALGGGLRTTDVAGFVAATYLRGVPWGGRADDARRPRSTGDRAARPGSTFPRGKNLVARSTARARRDRRDAARHAAERERRQGLASW